MVPQPSLSVRVQIVPDSGNGPCEALPQGFGSLGLLPGNLSPFLSGSPSHRQIPLFLRHLFMDLIDLLLIGKVMARIGTGPDNPIELGLSGLVLAAALALGVGMAPVIDDQVTSHGK
jgi:hypothetical protein